MSIELPCSYNLEITQTIERYTFMFVTSEKTNAIVSRISKLEWLTRKMRMLASSKNESGLKKHKNKCAVH